MKPLLIVMLTAFLLTACGHDDCDYPPGKVLGDATPEEIQAAHEVPLAIEAAGYGLPHYAVNYIHSRDDYMHGTTWSEYRWSTVQPTDGLDGYRGICLEGDCAVYIRRFGGMEDKLYSLLVHELLHAVGFEHGTRMKAAEQHVHEILGK